MNREVQKIIKDLDRQGWVVEVGRKHYKAKHPKGGFVFIAATPSDNRAIQNIKSDIKRLNRKNEDHEQISVPAIVTGHYSNSAA